MFEDNSKVRTLAALCELNAIKSPVHKCEFQIFNINRAQWEEINIATVFRNTPQLIWAHSTSCHIQSDQNGRVFLNCFSVTTQALKIQLVNSHPEEAIKCIFLNRVSIWSLCLTSEVSIETVTAPGAVASYRVLSSFIPLNTSQSALAGGAASV